MSVPRIIVASQSPDYIKAFKSGDINGDGIINDSNEAEKAAETFCQENKGEECKEFLDYLEKASYYSPRMKEISEKVDLDKVTDEISDIALDQTGEALSTLKMLSDRGLVEKFGIDNIKLLFGELAEYDSGVFPVRAFHGDIKENIEAGTIIFGNNDFTVKRLCRKIIADNYGIQVKHRANTIEYLNELLETPAFYDVWVKKGKQVQLSADIETLIKATRGYRDKSFAELLDYQKSQIRLLNRLILEASYPEDCPTISGWWKRERDWNWPGFNILTRYTALQQLIEAGIAEQIGVNNLIQLAKNTGDGTTSTYLQLKLMSDTDLMNRIGLNKLVEVSRMAGNGTDYAYLFLIALDEKGLLGNDQKIDDAIKIISEIAKKVGSLAVRSAYKSFSRLTELGITTKYGIVKIKNLLIEIGKATRNNDSVPAMMGGSAGAGGSGAMAYISFPPQGFRELETMAETGLFEKVGIEKLNRLAKITGKQLGLVYGNMNELNKSEEGEENNEFDVFGIDNIIMVAERLKGNAGHALDLLAGTNLVSKYGSKKAANFLIAIGEGAQEATNLANYIAYRLCASTYALDEYPLEKIQVFVVEMARTLAIYSQKSINDIWNAIEGNMFAQGEEKMKTFELEQIKTVSFEIIKAAGGGAGEAFLTFNSLAQNGRLAEIGIGQIKKLLVYIGENSGGAKSKKGAYKALREIARKGLVNQVGIDKLLSIAQKKGDSIYKEYEKIIAEYPEAKYEE
ncbi:MAG: hypothetical protein ABIH50_04020 [bacterium]